MTRQTDIAAQVKAPAGTSSNVATKSSPSSRRASRPKSGAAIAGMLSEPKQVAMRVPVPLDQPFELTRTEQCAKCPWKKSTNPHDIPNGYDPVKHRNLESTIATDDGLKSVLNFLNKQPLRCMACHEGHESHCLGWLMHQLGRGNNIHLRIAMMRCTNLDKVKLAGPQHETFEDTLPERNG